MSFSLVHSIGISSVAGALFLSLLGCSRSGSALISGDGVQTVSGQQIESLRQQVLTKAAPEKIESIDSAYESFLPDQPSSVITVAGRIYAEDISPFDKQEATFTVISLPKPGHSHEDPGDCPFCLRELRNAKFVIAKVIDRDGKTVQAPADQLLGLAKNDDVAITGTASQVGETLVVQVEKLHRLSKDASDALAKEFHK